jgi:hypothetical protein
MADPMTQAYDMTHAVQDEALKQARRWQHWVDSFMLNPAVPLRGMPPKTSSGSGVKSSSTAIMPDRRSQPYPLFHRALARHQSSLCDRHAPSPQHGRISGAARV